MILLCGIPSESPLAMVRRELDRLHIPYILFHQRNFASTGMEFEISRGQVTGLLHMNDTLYHLEDITGVYTRLMDDRFLPELTDEPAASPKRKYCRALHDILIHWCEIAPIPVINRTIPMGSNFSKPYQAQLIHEQGFAVPETLITNDPDLVREFYHKHGKVIYKSISSIRSIVQTLDDTDLERLDNIRWCPTQFQEFVEGTNVRVHVVDTSVFATAVTTDVTDYRYAHRQGGHTTLEAIELSDDLAERCIRLSKALGLIFTGVDLKITPDGEVFCLEVNPSPAFSYYEENTGQPIARAVACHLAGRG